jgi:hypothetical protein
MSRIGQRQRKPAGTTVCNAVTADVLPDMAPSIPKLSAQERRQLFARLLWLDDYVALLEAEKTTNLPLMAVLIRDYTSAHTRRLMGADTTQGLRAASQVESRLRDCIGFLERSRDRNKVPVSQAAKGIAYLASGVAKPVWEAERKARRVVGREYIVDLLREMVACRPGPPFEVQSSSIIASIGFDQTYAKSGGSVGVSAYNPIQTVDAQGNRKGVERMVYINGQYFPAPLQSTQLSPDALRLISQVGPYTQDFRRVLPLLQPHRMENVMDAFVVRLVGLVGSSRPASTPAAIRLLLSRPNDDPGGPTWLTFMTPLLWVNTQSYVDLIRIVKW